MPKWAVSFAWRVPQRRESLHPPGFFLVVAAADVVVVVESDHLLVRRKAFRRILSAAVFLVVSSGAHNERRPSLSGASIYVIRTPPPSLFATVVCSADPARRHCSYGSLCACLYIDFHSGGRQTEPTPFVACTVDLPTPKHCPSRSFSPQSRRLFRK